MGRGPTDAGRRRDVPSQWPWRAAHASRWTAITERAPRGPSTRACAAPPSCSSPHAETGKTPLSKRLRRVDARPSGVATSGRRASSRESLLARRYPAPGWPGGAASSSRGDGPEPEPVLPTRRIEMCALEDVLCTEVAAHREILCGPVFRSASARGSDRALNEMLEAGPSLSSCLQLGSARRAHGTAALRWLESREGGRPRPRSDARGPVVLALSTTRPVAADQSTAAVDPTGGRASQSRHARRLLWSQRRAPPFGNASRAASCAALESTEPPPTRRPGPPSLGRLGHPPCAGGARRWHASAPLELSASN
jgi:hypothetical protein